MGVHLRNAFALFSCKNLEKYISFCQSMINWTKNNSNKVPNHHYIHYNIYYIIFNGSLKIQYLQEDEERLANNHCKMSLQFSVACMFHAFHEMS